MVDYNKLGNDLLRRGMSFRRAEIWHDALRSLGDDRETLCKVLNCLLRDLEPSLPIPARWREAERWEASL